MQITCPYCGATTEVGGTSACNHCGKAVSTSVLDGRLQLVRGPWGCLLLLLLIPAMDMLSVLISLSLPSVEAAREAARRTQCGNNLKQIGVAMQSYYQTYGCFPPSFIPDENGKPKHSWRVLLLPFLGEKELYTRYRFDEPWNGPHNRELARQMPSLYRCPSTDRSQTGYAMLVGPHAISDGPTARRTSDIKDGLSNTIMVAEAAKQGIVWLEPRDLDTKKMSFHIDVTTRTPQGDVCEEISSHHAGLANVLFCDGSVRAISEQSPNPKTLEALTTIDGGEKVPAAY